MSGSSSDQGAAASAGRRAEKLRFLADHNVPESLALTLEAEGHDVVRLRYVMANDAPDPVVAMAAIKDQRILISWDRDFTQQRFKSPRFASLNRLAMSGKEVNGANRLAATLDIVCFAFGRASGKPLTVHVGASKVQLDV